MHRLRFIVLTVLLSCTASVFGQINCYDSSLNHSGVNPSIDSLEYHACQIDEGLPTAVTSNFKVFSAVEYTLHKYKDQADITRYRENTIDSLRQLNPYNLIFWWSPAEGNDLFGRCDLAFTYPSDDDFETCFSSIRTAIIASQLQELVESELATGNFGGNNYRALEEQVVRLLRQKIEAVQDCCASIANKSEDACTPCPVGEELLDLKRRAYLNEVGTYVPVGNETPIVVTLTTDDAGINKSDTEFLNLVGANLFFGELEIDLEAKYNEFLALGDTICAYPAYFTTDETLCLLDIDNWDRGDRSIINLASSDEGLVLEMSEYTDTDCYLFGDFLIDEYPEVFGYLIMNPFGRGALEEDDDEDLFNIDPIKHNCYYTPNGGLFYKQDYSVQGPVPLTELKLAKKTHNYPLNTLYKFKFNTNTYISSRKKNSIDYFLGYFDVDHIENILEDRRKLSTTILNETRFLNPEETNN